MSKQNQTTINYKKLDASKIGFTEWQKITDPTAKSKCKFVNYQDGKSQLLIQSPEILLDTYGIPTRTLKDGKPNKYYSEEPSSKHIRIPLNPDSKTSMEFKAKLESIDDHMRSDDVKKDLFGDRASDYEYSPIIRAPGEPLEKIDANGNTIPPDPNAYRPDSIKPKLWIDKNGKMVTKVYLVSVDASGKKIRTALPTEDTATDEAIAKYVKFKSTIQVVLIVSRLWADLRKDPKKRNKEYGIAFKVVQVASDLSTVGSQGIDYKNEDAFIDDEEEDEQPEVVKPVQVKKQPEPVPEPEPEDEAEDEEEEEEEEDEEEEEEAPPPPPPPKKSIQKPKPEPEPEPEQVTPPRPKRAPKK